MLTSAGNPGCGKTILAASVIQDLKINLCNIPVCYHFFSSVQTNAGLSNNNSAAYRAILSQILQQNIKNDRLKDLYLFALYFQSVGQQTASREEVRDLVG